MLKVQHQEKLEAENAAWLKKKVAALSEALGEVEAERVEEAHAVKADRALPDGYFEPVGGAGPYRERAAEEIAVYLLFGGALLGAQVYLMTQSSDSTVKAKTWATLEL